MLSKMLFFVVLICFVGKQALHSVTKSTFKNGPSPNFDFLDSVFRADFKNHNEKIFWRSNFWQMGPKVLNYAVLGHFWAPIAPIPVVVHNFLSAF